MHFRAKSAYTLFGIVMNALRETEETDSAHIGPKQRQKELSPQEVKAISTMLDLATHTKWQANAVQSYIKFVLRLIQ